MIECQPATTPVILGVFFRAFCFEINLIWNANTQTINCRRRDLVDQADLCPIASKHLWIDRVPVFSREILRKWLQVTNTFLGSTTKAEFRETRNQGVSQVSLKPRHACRHLGLTFFGNLRIRTVRKFNSRFLKAGCQPCRVRSFQNRRRGAQNANSRASARLSSEHMHFASPNSGSLFTQLRHCQTPLVPKMKFDRAELKGGGEWVLNRNSRRWEFYEVLKKIDKLRGKTRQK